MHEIFSQLTIKDFFKVYNEERLMCVQFLVMVFLLLILIKLIKLTLLLT